MNKRLFRPRQHHRGVAMVELAIVLPVLLTVLFAMAEIGRALLLQHQLVRHVEAAARYLGRSYQALNADCSDGPQWSTASATATQLALSGSEPGEGAVLIAGMTASDLSIAVLPRTAPGVAPACVVQVSASVAYPSIFGATIPLLGVAQPTLNARSEERYVGE
jgi:Flp pilus assembly protein TadG